MKTSENAFIYAEEELLRTNIKQSKLTIGIPAENTDIESRLALTPEGVSIVVEEGHKVLVQRGAGLPMLYTDLQYSEAGATIVDTAKEAFDANIVLKITPPTLAELEMMQKYSSVFSTLQLSNLSKASIEMMMKKGMNAFAYELIKDEQKAFPVISSVSEIEGNTAITLAAELLSNARGGKGLMLGGVAGISPTEVLIIGAGIAGTAAARTAISLGAQVKIFDHNITQLRKVQQYLGQHVFTSVIHPVVLFKALQSADVVIGNLRYINGSERFMVSEELVKTMKTGAVIIDLSVDQGGCFETSECRTMKNPSYTRHGVVHYCVPNLSARVARTTSMALSNIFAPMLLKIATSGSVNAAVTESAGFRNGAYVFSGILVNRLVGNYYGTSANDIGLLLARF